MPDIPNYGSDIPTIKGQATYISDTSKLNAIPKVEEGKVITPYVSKPEEKWTEQLRYWLFFGIGLSAFFSLLGIFNWRFLLFTPLGPILGTYIWLTRRLVKNYEEKNKKKKDPIL